MVGNVSSNPSRGGDMNSTYDIGCDLNPSLSFQKKHLEFSKRLDVSFRFFVRHIDRLFYNPSPLSSSCCCASSTPDSAVPNGGPWVQDVQAPHVCVGRSYYRSILSSTTWGSCSDKGSRMFRLRGPGTDTCEVPYCLGVVPNGALWQVTVVEWAMHVEWLVDGWL